MHGQGHTSGSSPSSGKRQTRQQPPPQPSALSPGSAGDRAPDCPLPSLEAALSRKRAAGLRPPHTRHQQPLPAASAASRTQDSANSPGKRCGTGREDGGEQVRVHVRTRASAPRPTPTPTPRPALTAQVAGRALAEPWLCSVHTANTGLGPPRGGSLQHAPTHHHKLGPQKNAHLRLFVPGASG